MTEPEQRKKIRGKPGCRTCAGMRTGNFLQLPSTGQLTFGRLQVSKMYGGNSECKNDYQPIQVSVLVLKADVMIRVSGGCGSEVLYLITN